MITRKVGKLLRGKATPFQIVAACLLGGLLGFAPALLQAPALYLLLIGLLLVVNANLGLALLVFGGARLLSWLIAPVSFQVGRFLLDGPTEGLAEAVVNAPVLAWCGLQYYAVAGGLPIGAALGLLLGALIARGVARFRRRMIAAADHPSRWKELSEKRWAKITIWLFFGGAGKQSWEQKLAKRVGNPIRVWGAALVLVLLVGFAFAHETLLGPLARSGMKSGLEQANGATADVGEVQLDLREGRFAVSALALADPQDLARDLLRAERFEADIDEADVLRRRLHVAKLVIGEVASGAPRETPGELVRPLAEDAYQQARAKLPDLEDLTLEDVISEYRVWEDRLAQARRWLDRLSGLKQGEEEGEEGFRDRIYRRAKENGWLKVQAEHLVDEAPTLRVTDLSVEGLTLAWLEGRKFDLKGVELSTHPWLLDTPPRLELASRDGGIGFLVDLAPVSKSGGDGAIRMHWKGLSVDAAMAKLKLPGAAPLRGGTIDLELDGSWADGKIGWLDLPLRVTFRDTTLAMKGIEPTRLQELVVPIGLSGPLDGLGIRFDGSTFLDALADAGRDELVRKLKAELGGELGGKLGELGVELPEGAGVEEQLEELTGQVEEQAKEEVEKKVEEEAKGVLKDLFGKKKGDAPN